MPPYESNPVHNFILRVRNFVRSVHNFILRVRNFILPEQIVRESLLPTPRLQTLPDSLADQRCSRVQLRRDRRTTARV
jgi:hypothetical protein